MKISRSWISPRMSTRRKPKSSSELSIMEGSNSSNCTPKFNSNSWTPWMIRTIRVSRSWYWQESQNTIFFTRISKHSFTLCAVSQEVLHLRLSFPFTANNHSETNPPNWKITFRYPRKLLWLLHENQLRLRSRLQPLWRNPSPDKISASRKQREWRERNHSVGNQDQEQEVTQNRDVVRKYVRLGCAKGSASLWDHRKRITWVLTMIIINYSK